MPPCSMHFEHRSVRGCRLDEFAAGCGGLVEAIAGYPSWTLRGMILQEHRKERHALPGPADHLNGGSAG